jgi:hypothetical protein
MITKAAAERRRADAILRLADHLTTVEADWLPRIYEARTQRFLHDNDRIWSSGSLLVPLSLAPFLALSSIENLRAAHFVFLGIASTLLMFLWFVIAESHRRYQDESLLWITAIESQVGVTFDWGFGFRRKLRARWARRVLAISVPTLWLAAGLWWPR